MTRCLTASMLCFILFTATACEKQETGAAHQPPEKTLLVGLLPEQNLFRQMERYGPLAEYLSRKTGLKIKLTILPRYGNIIDNFVQGSMDAAFFGSFTYVLAHAKLGVQVLARPEGLDGTSMYHGLIFVRRDSAILSARQMEGKRFAFVDKATTAGYLLPLAYFKKNRFDYKTGLRESYYSGTHEDTIYDVLRKKADIGAAKSTVFDRLAGTDERIRKELKILERSPDVPENGLAVRKNLDEALKRKIAEALLTMHDDDEGRAILKAFGARKFIKTGDSDYAPVHRYAREIGLKLASYKYIND